LVIDDDRAIRTLLRRELTAAGYRVQDAAPGAAGLDRITTRQFDLLIIGMDSAELGGPRVIETVREFSAVPILALSARDDEAITVAALRSGADDVIRTPFRVDEMLARTESALRRAAREKGRPAPLVTGDLEIDLLHRRVRAYGEEVRLGPRVYEVLQVLAEKADIVLTHQDILRAVWGDAYIDRLPYLRIAIRDLRRKLEADRANPRYILTEPRIGYRLAMHKRTARADAVAVPPLEGDC
jgi:two-component system KDP operon response regulator KdpE